MHMGFVAGWLRASFPAFVEVANDSLVLQRTQRLCGLVFKQVHRFRASLRLFLSFRQGQYTNIVQVETVLCMGKVLTVIGCFRKP